MPDQESKNLGWFWKLVESVLRSHAKNANLEFFQRKYRHSPVEIIAGTRIKTAAWYAGLVGSPVTVPTLAVSVPTGLVALAIEVGLLIRIQLHLAYDLFLLNGLPVDIEDPEQMQDIMQFAFGIKAVEVTGQALQKVIPQVAPQMLRHAMQTGLVRRKFQESVSKRLPRSFAIKYLGEGALIKALVPGIAIFTATWWDYTSTKGIGKTIQAKIRQRGFAVQELEKLKLDKFDNPKLVLQAVVFIGFSGRDSSDTDLTFYFNLVGRFRNFYGVEVIDSPHDAASLEWDNVTFELANVTVAQKREDIYKLLVAMVVVGGKLNRQKSRRLESLADSYGLTFDREGIELRCKPFEEPKPSRTCFFMILTLFVLMLLMCVLVLSIFFWLPSQ